MMAAGMDAGATVSPMAAGSALKANNQQPLSKPHFNDVSLTLQSGSFLK